MTHPTAAMREQIAYEVKCAAYNQPLMGVDWTRPENQRWLEVADRILATATDAARQEEREKWKSALQHARYLSHEFNPAVCDGCEDIDVLLNGARGAR